MKNRTIIAFIFTTLFLSCNSDKTKSEVKSAETAISQQQTDTLTKHLKPFNPDLPTIGLLMYNGVLQSEVIATSDVFSKPSKDGEQLFNVISIAANQAAITTEEGMHFVPDYTFENCPKLTALFVPSAYDMYAQVNNVKIIEFIKKKNKETKYTVSNCAGAQLIGKSGIARAARQDVLIKGGRSLEDLGGITAIAFDKTDTLTEGKPTLTDAITFGTTTRENLLTVAVSVET